MEKAKKARTLVVVTAIVIEIAALILIAADSRRFGITFLVIGMVFLVIAANIKSADDKTKAS